METGEREGKYEDGIIVHILGGVGEQHCIIYDVWRVRITLLFAVVQGRFGFKTLWNGFLMA